MRCPECDARVTREDDFCSRCGADIPRKDSRRGQPGPSVICPECGADCSPDADFCPECGASFVEESGEPDGLQ